MKPRRNRTVLKYKSLHYCLQSTERREPRSEAAPAATEATGELSSQDGVLFRRFDEEQSAGTVVDTAAAGLAPGAVAPRTLPHSDEPVAVGELLRI